MANTVSGVAHRSMTFGEGKPKSRLCVIKHVLGGQTYVSPCQGRTDGRGPILQISVHSLDPAQPAIFLRTLYLLIKQGYQRALLTPPPTPILIACLRASFTMAPGPSQHLCCNCFYTVCPFLEVQSYLQLPNSHTHLLDLPLLYPQALIVYKTQHHLVS